MQQIKFEIANNVITIKPSTLLKQQTAVLEEERAARLEIESKFNKLISLLGVSEEELL